MAGLRTIKVVDLQHGTQEFQIPEGTTALEVKRNGAISVNATMKLNGRAIGDDYDGFQDGDVVAATPNLKGGN